MTHRREDAARALLDGGADRDAHSDNGFTAPNPAVLGDCSSLARLLLMRGEDVDAAVYGGWTLLMQAAQLTSAVCTPVLLAAGADVHALGDEREGVMHFWAYGAADREAGGAAERRVATALLAAGAPLWCTADFDWDAPVLVAGALMAVARHEGGAPDP